MSLLFKFINLVLLLLAFKLRFQTLNVVGNALIKNRIFEWNRS